MKHSFLTLLLLHIDNLYCSVIVTNIFKFLLQVERLPYYRLTLPYKVEPKCLGVFMMYLICYYKIEQCTTKLYFLLT